MMILDVESGAGPRRIDLAAYLDAAGAERAQEDAYAWIKALRRLRVDGVPFRHRFTFRGDSLWWFAELYLHKEQAILHVMRTIAAFDALVERERPLVVRSRGRTPEWWPRPPPRARFATVDPAGRCQHGISHGWISARGRSRPARVCRGSAPRPARAPAPASRRSCTPPSGDSPP